MRLGSSRVWKATYLASLSGSTTSRSLDNEKPTHGMTMDHASTHRIRYIRSSGELIFNRSSRSKTLGFLTKPSTETCQPLVSKFGRRRGDSFLVGREFIEIIVMRDVLERGRRVAYAKATRMRHRRGRCQS